MKKFLTSLLCLTFGAYVYADVCPSVKELKEHKARLWRAFDSDDHKPLSAKREARLKTEITHFSMAEWAVTDKKNGMHCYYTNDSGSNLEAYFARENILSINTSKYWYPVTGQMQCAASPEKCTFQSLPDKQSQFASNE